jgi:hydroxypyruvate reductase
VKETARTIFRDTLASIDVQAAIERALGRQGPIVRIENAKIHLGEFREIVAIAFGKAAFSMARGLVQSLGPDYRPQGILTGPADPPLVLEGWQYFTGGHPVPNAASFAAGRAILDRLARCDERSLIFFLISGGGSSLVELPLDPAITLDEFRTLNSVLTGCGAPIEEINVVRKHLSATKGGRLTTAAPQSIKITLAISDVPEGQESALASGPTLPDPTTIFDAQRIVKRYGLEKKLPALLANALRSETAMETPKNDDPAFARAYFSLVLRAHDLLHAAHRACESEGFVSLCDSSTDNLPVDAASDQLLREIEFQKKLNPGKRVAVIADGEVSSPVTGNGIGGRNSAFVLACVAKIAGKKITVLSAGTDGIDGNSPAAGAVCDGSSLERAQEAGLDPADFFRRSDACTFFSRLGDSIVTGPTGNNLRDLRILLAEPE